jgi:hypothetical protein
MLLVLFAVVSAPCAGQDKPDDLFDPGSSSGALDLAKTPLWLTLLQAAGLEIRDSALQKQFGKELNNLKSQAETAIDDKDLGYLLKVELFTDEFGTVVVPAGQLVFPIGVGTEPTDSLAEFIRVPRLEGTPPAGMRNMSYYIWLKKRNGSLSGGMISREVRGVLEQRARDEARRRNLLGQWENALPKGGIRELQRDQYWSEVADKYSKFLAKEESRKRVEDLRQQFNAAEAKFNESYKQFQETAESLARKQQFIGALQTMGLITSIVGNAIKLGSMTSSTSPVNGSGQPDLPYKATLEYTKSREDALTGYHEEQRLRLEIQGQQLQQLDTNLRDLFKNEGVKIPKAEETLSIPRL